LLLIILLSTLAGARTSAVASDELPGLSVSDVSVPEGDDGILTDAAFTVTLSAATGQTVTLDYATADETATAPSDYASATGTVTFTPGTTVQHISVTVKGDNLDEDDESFFVSLCDPVHAANSLTRGVATIVDDDPRPDITIDSVTVPEGDSGTVDAGFTVMLSAESGRGVTVDYATADGTANAESDYEPASGTLAFAPGATSQLITIDVKGDATDEENEIFHVHLSDPVNADISDTHGIGTITDDDPEPSMSIDDVSVPEGAEGEESHAVFAAMLSAESGKLVTVDYATSEGTADVITEYLPISGSLTFTPGVTSQPITVTVKGDDLDEDNELFYVNLSNLTNAIWHDQEGVGTLIDDDSLPTVDFDHALYGVDEGSEPPTITLRLDLASGRLVTVDYATLDGTAEAGVDYEPVAGQLDFEPGDTVKAFQAGTTIEDTLDEHNETIVLSLTSMSNVTTGINVPATLTIRDDDPLPEASIDSVSVWEGNEGTTVGACFTAKLLVQSGRTVTVGYTTVDGTANASRDYVPASGTVVFDPGITSQPIPVTVKGDAMDEYDETFYTELREATYATMSVTRGVGTIADDDALPGISIDDVTVAEGDKEDDVKADFTVELSAESGKIVIVDYATEDCTADGGKDYVPGSGHVIFLAGETKQSVPIPVIGDNLDEQDETFLVNLSNPTNAFISDTQGIGNIKDDEPPLSISVGNVTVDEGDEGDETLAAFAASLSSESERIVQVHYATTDGTAKANSDYEPTSGIVSFAPGVITQTIPVTITGDEWDEYDEVFYLDMYTSTNATIADSRGTGTITDDDPLPWIRIAHASVLEGDDGETPTATFPVTLSAESGKTVTVDYATQDGTAKASSDYVTRSGTLTFTPRTCVAPDTTTQSIIITVTGDTIEEGDCESFYVNLSNFVNADEDKSDKQEKGVILDDEYTVYLPLALQSYPPVWRKGVVTPEQPIFFRTPWGCGSNTWYAGVHSTDNERADGIWKSTDNARTWEKIVTLRRHPYPVVANPNNCNQVFVSVWERGVYSITGSSMHQIGEGLDEKRVYGLVITDATLYAGTETKGVYRTDLNNRVWYAANTGIDEKRIRSLTATGNRIYAGARACTLYDTGDGGHVWTKHVVLPQTVCDDAQVWSIERAKITLYAGLESKGLYYNPEKGWPDDGWHNVDAIHNRSVHGLAYDEMGNVLYVSTDGNGMYRCGLHETGSLDSCQQYNPGLSTLNLREIRIHNGLLVASSKDGIWYLPLFQ
jgi:hypothetical protein